MRIYSNKIPKLTVLAMILLASTSHASLDVRHIELAVSQLDTAKTWYATHLPCSSVTERPKVMMCGGMRIELTARQSIGGSQGTAINHIGFSYPDVAAKMQELESIGVGGAGVRLQRFDDGSLTQEDPVSGRLHGYIFDPWGTRIELVEAGDAPAFHHVHLASADPEATQAWYVANLGAKTIPEGVLLGRIPLHISRNPEGVPAATTERAVDHIGLVSSDLNAATAALVSSGITVRGPSSPAHARGGAEQTLLSGPEGVRIKIVDSTWDGIAEVAAEERAVTSREAFVPPKTPWGEPDIQGMWSGNGAHGIPLERPEGVEGDSVSADQAAARREQGTLRSIWGYEREWRDTTLGYDKIQTSRQAAMIVDPPNGRLPVTTDVGQRAAEADAARRLVVAAGPEDLSSWVRCITRGLPTMMMPGVYNNGLQIQQSPGYVAIQNEMIHEARVIPISDKPRSGIKQWLGVPRGRWEGNTLVVETKDFNGRAAYRGAGENLTYTERFTVVDDGVLEYRFTMDDPTIWEAPWTAMFHFNDDGSQYELVEYACHEGNYGMTNILSAARAKDRELQESSGD